MTEKKNYCVDGKCTCESFENCKFYQYAIGCYHWYDYKNANECTSSEANDEWRKTNGTDN